MIILWTKPLFYDILSGLVIYILIIVTCLDVCGASPLLSVVMRHVYSASSVQSALEIWTRAKETLEKPSSAFTVPLAWAKSSSHCVSFPLLPIVILTNGTGASPSLLMVK